MLSNAASWNNILFSSKSSTILTKEDDKHTNRNTSNPSVKSQHQWSQYKFFIDSSVARISSRTPCPLCVCDRLRTQFNIYHVYNSWNTWLCILFFLRKSGKSPFLYIWYVFCCLSEFLLVMGWMNWDHCDRGQPKCLQTKLSITGSSTDNFMLDKSSLIGDPALARGQKKICL